MICIKLTVLSLVLTLIYFFVVRIMVVCSGRKTQMNILLNKPPKWFMIMVAFLMIMILMDVVGIICSTIWLLFLR